MAQPLVLGSRYPRECNHTSKSHAHIDDRGACFPTPVFAREVEVLSMNQTSLLFFSLFPLVQSELLLTVQARKCVLGT